MPNETTKVTETRVKAAGIGFIYNGQAVEVKLEPFSSNIYSLAWENVQSIVPFTVQDLSTRGILYYADRTELPRVSRGNSKKRCDKRGQLPTQVGMPAVVDFWGPKRTALRYLFPGPLPEPLIVP